MKPGDIVSIYKSPLTGGGYAGEATLLRRHETCPCACDELAFKDNPEAHTEHWYVDIDGDEKLVSVLCESDCTPRFKGDRHAH